MRCLSELCLLLLVERDLRFLVPLKATTALVAGVIVAVVVAVFVAARSGVVAEVDTELVVELFLVEVTVEAKGVETGKAAAISRVVEGQEVSRLVASGAQLVVLVEVARDLSKR